MILVKMLKPKSFIKKYGQTKILLLVAIGAIVLGGVSVYALRHSDKKVPDAQDVTLTQSSASTQGTESTKSGASVTGNNSSNTQAPSKPQEDWKTYSSPLGVSVRYPSGWKLTDRTAASNEDLSISLESNPSGTSNNFYMSLDVYKPKVIYRYPVDENVQTLSNGLRYWLIKQTSMSRRYNNGQEFDCPRLRLLDKSENVNVPLMQGRLLSSEAGFCMNQDTYTTKTYAEQVDSQEWRDALNIYTSITVQ